MGMVARIVAAGWGGQSGCSTTPYQQHVVSYNPERKLSLEATEASRESSQRVRKTRVSEALCMRFNPQSRRRVRNNDCCVPEEA